MANNSTEFDEMQELVGRFDDPDMENWDPQARGDKATPQIKPAPKETANHTLPEAPASATAKVKSTNGFSWLFTLRADSGTGLIGKLTAFEKTILAMNWTPEANGYGNVDSSPKIATRPELPKDASCAHELFSIKESKSEKNPGRKFKQCSNKACPNSFLGWV